MYNIDIEQGLTQLPMVKRIREDVFVKEQQFSEENEFDDIDEHAFHVLISDQDLPMATGRIYQKDITTNKYYLGRIAVLKEYRNLHLGSMIVEALENQALNAIRQSIKEPAYENNPTIIFELSAQVRVQKFYEKLGYEAQGDIYLDEHEPHITMQKNVIL